MTESEMVEAISVDANPVAAAALTESGQGWFGMAMAAREARRAVAAWATAVNGDGTRLASMADPDAAHWLLYPVRKAWAIAPGPVVTEITIWTVKPAAEPPELGVAWRFTGRQRPVEPGPPEPGLARPSGWSDAEQVFVGNLTLAFTGPAAWPWRLTHGHVSTLDDYLGYTFTSRSRRPRSAGGVRGPPPATGCWCRRTRTCSWPGSPSTMRSSAPRPGWKCPATSAPARDAAEKLIWPAIWAETSRALGPGDWRPSLGWLDMIRLLGPAPAGDVAWLTGWRQRGCGRGTRSVSAASGSGGVRTSAAMPAATRQAAAPVSSAARVPPALVIAPSMMDPSGVVPI